MKSNQPAATPKLIRFFDFVVLPISRILALRVVNLPQHRRPEFSIRWDNSGGVLLPLTPDTKLTGNPGHYTLRFYEKTSNRLLRLFRPYDVKRAGVATISNEARHLKNNQVFRQISEVQQGDITKAAAGWISGWLGTEIANFDDAISAVTLQSSDGVVCPAWLLTPVSSTRRVVIHIHGRGATAAETARNFDLFRKLGYTNLAISYRGDTEATGVGSPNAVALGLGTTEWLDLESAIEYASTAGATEIIVFGWSYGAAITWQFLKRSKKAYLVNAIICDSPVVDWGATLRFQGKSASIPSRLVEAAQTLLASRRSARSLGLAEPINFEDFLPSTIATYLKAPTLILHSVDDGYIPFEPCIELANAAKPLVFVEKFSEARHCKLYNFDRIHYERAIAEFLGSLNKFRQHEN